MNNHIDARVLKENKNSFWELIRFAAISLLIIVPIRMYIMQPFVVSGESMVPTFHDKDYLIIDEISYRFNTPKRGDVIVFHPPNESKKIYYIKRIIGLPGETVILDGTKVIIKNTEHPEGFELDQPYLENISSNQMTITVGKGDVFVLGDNRPRSSDSRIWGTLPLKNIKGRPYLRLYPFTDIAYLPGVHNYELNK